MKLHHFVSGSSVILAGWLAITFVCHVPAQRYQKHETFPTTAVEHHKTKAETAATARQAAVFPVSVSR
jgi:hypothetical protein